MQAIRIGLRGKGRPRTRAGAAMGDKAYSSAANRAYRRYVPAVWGGKLLPPLSRRMRRRRS